MTTKNPIVRPRYLFILIAFQVVSLIARTGEGVCEKDTKLNFSGTVRAIGAEECVETMPPGYRHIWVTWWYGPTDPETCAGSIVDIIDPPGGPISNSEEIPYYGCSLEQPILFSGQTYGCYRNSCQNPMGNCVDDHCSSYNCVCSGSFNILLYPAYVKRPEIRPPTPTPTPPPDPKPTHPCGDAGNPINVVTGNVWLDQTDVVLPGIGAGLEVIRAYNSVNSATAGAFGRGWTHTYERSLSFPETKVIEYNGANGAPLYFEDFDDDGTFKAMLPVTERSTMIKSGEDYVRLFTDGSSETYDSQGRLMTLMDAAGNNVTLQRDASGRLVHVSDSSRSLIFEYDGASVRIARLLGPSGLISSYTYQDDFLRSVSYPDGSGYTFTYDSQGRLEWITDASGRIVEKHAYDASGYGATSELADGREKLTFTYYGGKTVITDALGEETNYHWREIHGVRRVFKVEGPCSSCGGGSGETQEWSYDEFGHIVAYTDAAGTVTQYTYNDHGDMETETQAVGTPLERTTTYTYVYDGSRIASMTRNGPDGSVMTTTYGPAGPLTVSEKVNETETRTTSMTYTPQGQVETTTDPRGKTTTYAYTAEGDLESITDPLDNETTFGYDQMGRRTSVTDPLGHTTTTVYDARGRVTSIVNQDGTHTDYAYDKGGRRTSVTDPKGRTTYYVYDDYGWLERVVDPAGGVTKYGYDLMGNMTSLTDAMGRTTSFEYDAGRLTRIVYPGAGEPSEIFNYDTAGRLATKTDRNGVVTTFTYDDLGRLTGKSYSDGVTPPATYTYDENGHIGYLTTASNGTDTLQWTYDLAGQLVTEQSTKNASTVAYTYDLAGNRLTVSLNGQLHVEYAYDDASRLDYITRGSSTFDFDYDDASRRISMTYPNGVVTSYTYDDLNRLTNIGASHASPLQPPITSFTYTYDDAGNRTSKAALDYTENYAYDKLDQLIGADRPGVDPRRWLWSYDKVGNRLTQQVDDTATTSTYNEKNQLVSRAGGGLMRWRGTLDEPGNVTFTSATVNGKPARILPGNVFEADLPMQTGPNTVTIEAVDASGNVSTKTYSLDVFGDAATYTYDSNGNLTQKTENGHVWGYEWNAENQLVRVTKDAAEVATFKYDPIGRRVEKVSSGVTTSYTFVLEDILREISSGITYTYIHGLDIDEPVATESGGSVAYYHADDLGSVTKITDFTGAIIHEYRYNAWGDLEVGDNRGGYSFTGREWDSEIGLYYYRNRYYDPSAGRFLKLDSYDDITNHYIYVLNNPTIYNDPYGLQAGDAKRVIYLLKCRKKYKVCSDRVIKECEDKYPSTTEHPGPVGGGDDNLCKRINCEREELKKQCYPDFWECGWYAIRAKDPDKKPTPTPIPCPSPRPECDWEHPWRYDREEIKCCAPPPPTPTP